MPYVLGLDVGTSTVAAATCRLAGPARPEVVGLGASGPTIPAVVHLDGTGAAVVGAAALECARTEPGHAAHGPITRIGDDVPLILGDAAYPAQALVTAQVTAVLHHVQAREGTAPRHVAVTHPATWGPYRTGLLHQQLRRAGLTDLTLLPEPLAAAENHAARQRVDPGTELAVLDLGGGHPKCALVRRTAAGPFEMLTCWQDPDPRAGTHLDDLLVAKVRTALGFRRDEPDPGDPDARCAMADLRQECVSAKEALSTATETTIPVYWDGAYTPVPVTRQELHELAEPAVGTTAEALARLLRFARHRGRTGVLLVGGTTRLPLVAEMLAARLGTPPLADPAPQTAVAAGAALVARHRLVGAPRLPVTVVGSDEEPTVLMARLGEQLSRLAARSGQQLPALRPVGADDTPLAPPPPRPPVEVTPLKLPPKRRSNPLTPGAKPVGLAAAAAGVIAAGALWAFAEEPANHHDPPRQPASSTSKPNPTGAAGGSRAPSPSATPR
ncbi:hypothetical protein GCM10012275_37380 [Longimycelium tulufanense]|uniref:Uncharacterized protein n=1 Tax=Longimycelium tulufanense TaxID=907463 RepID=A0A8J3CGN6_9PSEU|nr:Hsp70 family protein [Longimycelium tulufanense]GGM63286.1 hypothetical protein GCM10012275_37380 [Longimycelium tulufanense]